MAAVEITVTRPTDVQHTVFGNKKVRFFDITADTGDYAPGGFDLDASAFGLRHIDYCDHPGFATQGTDGASAVGLGSTYNDDGTTVTFQLYEVDTAADGAPFQEKGAEAFVANFTFRVKVVGH